MIATFFKNSSVFSYLLSLALLAVVVYGQGETGPSLIRINTEKSTALFLLSLCLLAVDWTVKKQYWAKQANFHLLFFPLFVFALPLGNWNNWMLVFLFFVWIAFTYLVALDQSTGNISKVFNAFFFFFSGSLFFPQGIILLPLLWWVMGVKGAFNHSTFLVSIVPIAALFLLEVVILYFFPEGTLIPEIDLSAISFSHPLQALFRMNLWWIIFLLLFFFSLFKHYVDMGSKSASYGAGMIGLFVMTIVAILFGLAFQKQSHFAWVFFLMPLTALSTRLFEEIHRSWLRELIVLVIVALVFFGKFGFPA